jgi:hypothetical protein
MPSESFKEAATDRIPHLLLPRPHLLRHVHDVPPRHRPQGQGQSVLKTSFGRRVSNFLRRNVVFRRKSIYDIVRI